MKAIVLACAVLPAAWWMHTQLGHVAQDDDKAVRTRSELDEVTYYLDELEDYDGQPWHGGDGTLLLAVWGRVFNVTTGSEFYAPTMGYEIFAGHDCTLALAKVVTKKSLLNQGLDGLTEEQVERLNTTYWETYVRKYPIIGLLSDPPYNASAYDLYAGAFSEVGPRAVETRRQIRQGLGLLAESNSSTRAWRRQSKCPVTRAARAAARTVANFFPRLLLGGPS